MVNKGVGELPPGAALSDSNESDTKDVNDPHRALNIDLDLPLRDEERLSVVQHRIQETRVSASDKTADKSEKVSNTQNREEY